MMSAKRLNTRIQNAGIRAHALEGEDEHEQ